MLLQPGDHVTQLGDPGLRQVIGDPTRTDERVVHPQAGQSLQEVEHDLTLAEADRHHRQRADLHAAGADSHQVGRDAVELHHQHANVIGALGDLILDAEQPLDRQAVGHLVEEGHQIVHAGDEGGALHPGAVLGVLLDAGVQEADTRTNLRHGLAVALHHHPQHAMGRGVLRAHVDDEGLVFAGGLLLGDLSPVTAHDGVDGALGRLARRGVDVALFPHR